MSASFLESQRDSVLQPRVGELASLPWVTRSIRSQPQRGCVLGRTSNCHNRVAVEIHFASYPRVVAPLQPWAELRYPVGVMRAATVEREKATLQNAVTATDQKIDALVYELYGLTPEGIQLVEGNE